MIIKKIIGLFLLLFISIDAFASETLVFVFDVIRHGDRTPLHVIPKVPYEWPQGLGELTPEGMQQEFQRGVEFRKEYVDHAHLLSAHYNNKEISIFSTDANRTLMSAQSVLLGLYPLGTGPVLSKSNQSALPSQFQPVPIHIIPKDGSDNVESDFSQQMYKALKKHVLNRPDWIQKNAALQLEMVKWSQVTGFKLKHLSQLRQLSDALYIYQLHHIPLPAGLSTEDVQRIITIGREATLAEYQTKAVADVIGVPVLAMINDYLEKASQQKTPLKYVLFSAHDATIMSLMTTLGHSLTEKPPYGANLKFSLYKTDSHAYLIKVTYNGKLVKEKHCEAQDCSFFIRNDS